MKGMAIEDRCFLEAFGKHLHKARRDKKIDAEALATKMGVSKATIGALEQSKQNPSFLLAVKLIQVLELDLAKVIDTADKIRSVYNDIGVEEEEEEVEHGQTA